MSVTLCDQGIVRQLYKYRYRLILYNRQWIEKIMKEKSWYKLTIKEHFRLRSLHHNFVYHWGRL